MVACCLCALCFVLISVELCVGSFYLSVLLVLHCLCCGVFRCAVCVLFCCVGVVVCCCLFCACVVLCFRFGLVYGVCVCFVVVCHGMVCVLCCCCVCDVLLFVLCCSVLYWTVLYGLLRCISGVL